MFFSLKPNFIINLWVKADASRFTTRRLTPGYSYLRQRIDAFELWRWRRLLRESVIQPVHPKGDQPWVFFGRTDAKAETPVLWSPHVKSWLTAKDSDAGRDWGREKEGTMEDEMAGWHHRLDGRGFEWTLRDGDGQGGLVCCNSWGHRVGHNWVTELNWTE